MVNETIDDAAFDQRRHRLPHLRVMPVENGVPLLKSPKIGGGAISRHRYRIDQTLLSTVVSGAEFPPLLLMDGAESADPACRGATVGRMDGNLHRKRSEVLRSRMGRGGDLDPA